MLGLRASVDACKNQAGKKYTGNQNQDITTGIEKVGFRSDERSIGREAWKPDSGRSI